MFVLQGEDEHHFRKPANDITSQLEINFGDLGRPGRGRGGPRGGRGGRGRGEATRPVRGGRTDKVDNVIKPKFWCPMFLCCVKITNQSFDFFEIQLNDVFFFFSLLSVICVCAQRGRPRGLPSPGLSLGCWPSGLQEPPEHLHYEACMFLDPSAKWNDGEDCH